MKKKTKIAIVSTAVAIASLTIIAYHTEPVSSPVSPQIAPVSEVVAIGRTYTPPMVTEPIVAEEIAESSTHTEEITEPTHQQKVIVIEDETLSPQPTEKEITDITPTQDIQMTTKPISPTPADPTPKNGDTRIVNGQQQGYLLGFGWVDYMGENEVIYCEDMYENGNKVGIMD